MLTDKSAVQSIRHQSENARQIFTGWTQTRVGNAKIIDANEWMEVSRKWYGDVIMILIDKSRAIYLGCGVVV